MDDLRWEGVHVAQCCQNLPYDYPGVLLRNVFLMFQLFRKIATIAQFQHTSYTVLVQHYNVSNLDDVAVR